MLYFIVHTTPQRRSTNRPSSLHPHLVPQFPTDRTEPQAFADFSNTSAQSNLKIFVPAIPAELNSISYDLFYGEFMLWRLYSNLSLYVILSQCFADHPTWTLLLRHFLLNHSSFMLDLWNYGLYVSHSVTTFSVSSYCWVHSRVSDFPVAQMVKNLPAHAGDLGLIPGLGRSPGNGNPLQYSCLEKPMDRGAWRAIVCVFTKSWTWLSD